MSSTRWTTLYFILNLNRPWSSRVRTSWAPWSRSGRRGTPQRIRTRSRSSQRAIRRSALGGHTHMPSIPRFDIGLFGRFWPKGRLSSFLGQKNRCRSDGSVVHTWGGGGKNPLVLQVSSKLHKFWTKGQKISKIGGCHMCIAPWRTADGSWRGSQSRSSGTPAIQSPRETAL